MNEFKFKNDEFDPEFDGVFRFTNPTDEDFITLWNNKEYLYPAQQTVPMIIADESLERVQNIRKMFAKRLAEREYYKTKAFKDIRNGIKNKEMGSNVVPSSFNENVLQETVDACLKPLPLGKQKVHSIPAEEPNIKASKPFTTKNPNTLYPNVDLPAEFKESNEEMLKQRVS